MKFVFVTGVPKHFNFATFSKDLLAICKLWFCPAVWRGDTNMYLAFSSFTSGPASLLVSNTASVFFLTMFVTSKVVTKINEFLTSGY